VANSNWARLTALYAAIADDQELVMRARETLGSFGVPEVEAHGVFASTYLLAADVLTRGPVRVDIHVPAGKTTAESSLWPEIRKRVVRRATAGVVPDLGPAEPEYAVVCGSAGCSVKMADAREVEKHLRTGGPSHL
jgi:uncharacterized protein YyaL (SSP411 family)